MIELIMTLLDIDGSQLTVGDNGQITVDWGGRDLQTKPKTDRSSNKNKNKTGSSRDSYSKRSHQVTEIQRLVDLMDQVTDLFKYHQSMIQQI